MFQRFLLLLLAVLILLTACYPTRFVPENEYLLKKNKIQCSNKNISLSDLESYIKPKPNKKILWIIPFHLYIYNLSKNGKERKWKNKLRDIIGEAPVLVNTEDIKKSKEQLKLYLRTKGYYNSQVNDSIFYLNPKKAKVVYSIISNDPYVIDSINIISDDNVIKRYVEDINKNSYIKKGNLLDEELLQNERDRITLNLKNLGYYYFTKDFIEYEVDTSLGKNKVILTIRILNDYSNYSLPHKRYIVDSILVFHDFNPKLALQNKDEYYSKLDTIQFKNIFILGNSKLSFKPNLLDRMIFIKPNQFYNYNDAQITYNKYASLNNFRLVNIKYVPSGRSNGLNCLIQLTPLLKQSYRVEAEGTNSSGNLGIAGNIIYNNRNLLGGAQKLSIKLHGSIERQTAVVQQNDEQIQQYLPFNALELSTEGKLELPSLAFPYISESFLKRRAPTTLIQGLYSYQQRPDYTRTISTVTFGYQWYGNKNLKHFINPIEFNYVQIPFISWRFKNLIRNTFLENSYANHMETITSYGFYFNDPKVGRKKQNTINIRGKIETSGNILYAYFKNIKKSADTTTYNLFDVPFSQFIKAEIDFRYYKFITNQTKLIYRFLSGAGYPYGNSEVLPFNRQYFSGGASGIRAWAVRSLGPGSFADTTNRNIYNQTADIKLEGNIEYRFKLFWVIEPAFYIDVGNIWDIKKKINREIGVFKIEKFYKDIAIGYGIGFRFNFSFFIFRVDFSAKGKDPAESIGNRWLFVQRKPLKDDFTINVGIGYPF